MGGCIVADLFDKTRASCLTSQVFYGKIISMSERDIAKQAAADLIRSDYNYRCFLYLEEVAALVSIGVREVNRLVEGKLIPSPIRPFNKKTPLWIKHEFFAFLQEKGFME